MNYLQQFSWKYGSIWLPKTDQGTLPAIRDHGEYCESEVDVFRMFLQPGDVVIDGGASYGCMSLAFLSLDANVLAFEAHPQVFEVLQQNTVSFANFKPVFPSALHSTKHKSYMQPINVEDASAFCGIHETGAIDGVEVDCIPLDVLHLTVCDFIKLDVEYDEAHALKGALRTLRQCQPVVYLEYWKNQAEIRELLKDAGYRKLWLHHPPRDRFPNFKNVPVESTPGPPMLLAIPQRWLGVEGTPEFQACGFHRVD
jgi:FkbM family methyltransferase